MFGGAAAVAVSGRRGRHFAATWLLSGHRPLVSVETAATGITAEPRGASLWTLKATPQQPALRRGVERADVRAAQRLHNRCMQDQTKRNLLLTVWLSECKQPNLGYEDRLNFKKIDTQKRSKGLFSPHQCFSSWPCPYFLNLIPWLKGTFTHIFVNTFP